MRNEWIFWMGVALAASYLAASTVDPTQPIGPVWKALGILLFGIYALAKRGSSTVAWQVGAGLFASAIGDAVLALEPPDWTSGMAAFGLAHIFYAVAFLRVLYTDGSLVADRLLALGAAAASIALYVWLLPGMGELFIPGTAYHVIITAMVALALMSRATPMAKVGAVLFLVSDLVLALGLYKGLGPFGPLNWMLYAPAQALICYGLIRPAKDAPEQPAGQ